jgi:hypothetical protein
VEAVLTRAGSLQRKTKIPYGSQAFTKRLKPKMALNKLEMHCHKSDPAISDCASLRVLMRSPDR